MSESTNTALTDERIRELATDHFGKRMASWLEDDYLTFARLLEKNVASSLRAENDRLREALQAFVKPTMRPRHLSEAEWESMPWIIAARSALSTNSGKESQ